MNIVQYPKGGALKYAIRHNFYTGMDGDTYLRYVTDTERGASGSPVFNDDWQVVALHHAAAPATGTQGQIGAGLIASDSVIPTPNSSLIYLNEGIAIHKILGSLDPSIIQEIKTAQGW